ncbi:hypothetical protein P8452_49706 [Trifolium repens]|jgi:hypothetical protein|nr:hypothetical protein P8452_49706 [Trifolium repens]
MLAIEGQTEDHMLANYSYYLPNTHIKQGMIPRAKKDASISHFMATFGGCDHGDTAPKVKLFCASVTHASIRVELATILSHDLEFRAF